MGLLYTDILGGTKKNEYYLNRKTNVWNLMASDVVSNNETPRFSSKAAPQPGTPSAHVPGCAASALQGLSQVVEQGLGSSPLPPSHCRGGCRRFGGAVSSLRFLPGLCVI